jgi:hypothetical protein
LELDWLSSDIDSNFSYDRVHRVKKGFHLDPGLGFFIGLDRFFIRILILFFHWIGLASSDIGSVLSLDWIGLASLDTDRFFI